MRGELVHLSNIRGDCSGLSALLALTNKSKSGVPNDISAAGPDLADDGHTSLWPDTSFSCSSLVWIGCCGAVAARFGALAEGVSAN